MKNTLSIVCIILFFLARNELVLEDEINPNSAEIDINLFDVSTRSVNRDSTLYTYDLKIKETGQVKIVFKDFKLLKNCSFRISNKEGEKCYVKATDKCIMCPLFEVSISDPSTLLFEINTVAKNMKDDNCKIAISKIIVL